MDTKEKVTSAKIKAVTIDGGDKSINIIIDWATEKHWGEITLIAHAGEGNLVMQQDGGGLFKFGTLRAGTSKLDDMKLTIDSETLGADFVKKILCALVDGAEKIG
jgi:hypothetical protein